MGTDLIEEDEKQIKKRAEIAFQVDKQIDEARRSITRNFIVLGGLLSRVYKDELWKYYGEHLESFEDYLKEKSIKRSTGYQYMRVFEEFKDFLTASDTVPVRRLVKLLPHTDKIDKEKWVNKARLLPAEGFNNEIRELKGKTTTDECDHPLIKQSFFTKCKECGKFIKRDVNWLKKVIDKL